MLRRQQLGVHRSPLQIAAATPLISCIIGGGHGTTVRPSTQSRSTFCAPGFCMAQRNLRTSVVRSTSRDVGTGLDAASSNGNGVGSSSSSMGGMHGMAPAEADGAASKCSERTAPDTTTNFSSSSSSSSSSGEAAYNGLPAGAAILPVSPGTDHVVLRLDLQPSQLQALCNRPFMLHLPDLDGSGITSQRQWPQLSSRFEMRSLQLSIEHSGSFVELAEAIAGYIQIELSDAPAERPVYILGEGAGAVLALGVARRSKIVQRLVLTNPATPYPESLMARIAPLLARLPPGLSGAAPLVLAPALLAQADPRQFAAELLRLRTGGHSSSSSSSSSIGGGAAGAISSLTSALLRPDMVVTDAVSLLTDVLRQLATISEALPSATLSARLALLQQGCDDVGPRLNSIQQRTMVITGGRDVTLPSVAEGERLALWLQRAFVRNLPLAGHAPLSEPGIDLVDLMEEEGFLLEFTVPLGPGARLRTWRPSAAGPLELPTRREYERLRAGWTQHFFDWCSPVFLSTLADGRVVHGLDGLPARARPLLLVGNHQLCGQDVMPLVDQVWSETGTLVRGLTHPNLFGHLMATEEVTESEEFGYQDQLANVYATMGCVKVTPNNFFKVMRDGEAAILFPGGLREAFKRKGEKYGLSWPAKPEFVRLASRFGATIVPVSAIGLEDSLSLLMDTRELMTSELTKGIAAELNSKAIQARVGASVDPENDHPWVPPIVAPRPPSRLYYLFGRPITLTPDIKMDREKSEAIYREIKTGVEDGIGYLLRKREQDPYKDFLPRYLHENPLMGRGSKAPTFRDT